MSLSEMLKELRRKNDLTQEQLAEELNVSRQAIAKWESGAGLPDIENLKNISIFFHVSTDSLLNNVTVEKEMSLKDKFRLVEIFLFLIGISLGIVAGNFAFGFVMALLLPGFVYCIELIVLEKRYKKQKDFFAQREILASQLPKNFFGRILNTNKHGRMQRIKWYVIEAGMMAALMTLFTIVGSLFEKTELRKLEIFSNTDIDTILSYVVSFVLMFSVFFMLRYIRYEYIVKKYNLIGRMNNLK
jgi:Predicted transcriptional regulators